LQSNVFNIYASDVAPKFGPKRAPAWDMPVDWPSSDVGNVSVGWSVSADVIAIMCLRVGQMESVRAHAIDHGRGIICRKRVDGFVLINDRPGAHAAISRSCRTYRTPATTYPPRSCSVAPAQQRINWIAKIAPPLQSCSDELGSLGSLRQLQRRFRTGPSDNTNQGYRQSPPSATNAPPPLVRLNPVQSKLPSFYCECRDTERQINSSRCILTVQHAPLKVMMYIVQFNENTKHTFRLVHCYILFPVCL